jgi:hypothetical protein
VGSMATLSPASGSSPAAILNERQRDKKTHKWLPAGFRACDSSPLPRPIVARSQPATSTARGGLATLDSGIASGGATRRKLHQPIKTCLSTPTLLGRISPTRLVPSRRQNIPSVAAQPEFLIIHLSAPGGRISPVSLTRGIDRGQSSLTIGPTCQPDATRKLARTPDVRGNWAKMAGGIVGIPGRPMHARSGGVLNAARPAESHLPRDAALSPGTRKGHFSWP